MSDQKPPAKKKLKVQLSFDPSPDVVNIANSGRLGEAGYVVTLYLDRGSEPQVMKLPPQADSFEFVAFEEQDVVATVSAVDRNGIHSLATIVRMKVPPAMPPARPNNLRISRIMPALDVIMDHGPVPAETQPASAEGYTVTVTGHPVIKDGAVGNVLGLDPKNSEAVLVSFAATAFKSNMPPAPHLSLDRRSPGKVTILSPNQESMSIGEYIELWAAVNKSAA